MKFFGKVFIEFWDGEKWNLSAIWWQQYLIARFLGICGSATSNPIEYNYRHVSRKNINFT